MPEVTPIYGFPYPCHGDPVDVADFAALANAIDAKMLEVQADADNALARYNVMEGFTGTQVGIAAGVDTVITLPASQYTVPESGIYLPTYDVLMSTAGTVTSSRLRVRLNGVVQYGQRQNNENNSLVQFHVPATPLICAAGDVISSTYLYTGTLTGDVTIWFAVRQIVKLA